MLKDSVGGSNAWWYCFVGGMGDCRGCVEKFEGVARMEIEEGCC